MAVDDPNVIDFVARDPSGDVVLVMVEGREWNSSDDRLLELQEKINRYVAFVLDGQMLEQYPELAGKPVRLELRCVAAPDSKTADFLALVHEKLTSEGLGLDVKLTRPHSGQRC